MPAMNKWEVTTDPLTLRRLGKLGEELGELANVASRCIIQGIDATDPGTGKVNRQRLLDELADVAAQIDCTMTAFGLDTAYFGKRRSTKREQMAEWEALYRPVGVPVGAPAWEYHWLVELFHRGDGAPSVGRYHTGLTDISQQSRSTTQPHEARRYTKEQAQRVAGELNVHMMSCEWRAVEHGFLVATNGVKEDQRG